MNQLSYVELHDGVVQRMESTSPDHLQASIAGISVFEQTGAETYDVMEYECMVTIHGSRAGEAMGMVQEGDYISDFEAFGDDGKELTNWWQKPVAAARVVLTFGSGFAIELWGVSIQLQLGRRGMLKEEWRGPLVSPG